jgi:cytochrome c oxidase subunit II
MTILIAILCVILLAIVVVQIGKVTELAGKLRGEEVVELESNNRSASWLLIFGAGFLIFCIWSAWYYKNSMLGYGPHESASVHGSTLDSLFNVTLFFTGVVFVLTQAALFWFSYKYKKGPGTKATYISHDNKLEIIWTIIPTIVMTILVINGLVAWNDVMADISEDEEYIEIEAMGYQFAWTIRYPGKDGKLGARDFRLINLGNNPMGQDWEDVKNHDDFHADEIVLPVGKKVRVRITSRDVLHNFYLPHFRVKMDAVPGIPTYFVFTPEKTTDDYRQMLRPYDEYQVPTDANDPQSDPKWKTFNYELACAELCGTGHYSMRKIVRIVSEEEYNTWLDQQTSWYANTIRNTDADPFKGKALPIDAQIEAEEMIGAESDTLNEIENVEGVEGAPLNDTISE